MVVVLEVEPIPFIAGELPHCTVIPVAWAKFENLKFPVFRFSVLCSFTFLAVLKFHSLAVWIMECCVCNKWGLVLEIEVIAV